MNIYLPIAEMSMNIFNLIGLGGIVGFLSGLLGVSGGFLLTPSLILMGIPSSIAVASQSANVIATSTTGSMTHIKKNNVDYKMAFIVLFGGMIGSSVGVWVFTILNESSQLDLTVKILYMIFLTVIGLLMFWELGIAKIRKFKKIVVLKKLHKHNFMHRLPLRTKFKKSRLYISSLFPMIIGMVVGFLSALMGIGGGFIMVPAMIYLLGMHTSVVVGTTLFQGIFVSINATFWQASINHTVDFLLAFILIIGGVVGARIGSSVSSKLPADRLRIILASIVIFVSIALFVDLIMPPKEIYSIVSPKGAW